MLNLIGRLKTQTNLSASEKKLTTYILDHKEKVILMSSEQLANASNTSIACVYRLCKKIKVNGFAEFKTILAKETNEDINEYKKINFNMPFQKEDSSFDVAQKVSNLYWQSVAYTLNTLDFNELETIAHCIRHAHNVFFLTSHMNIAIADTFERRMSELGIHIHVLSEINEQRLACSLSKKGDVAILLSYSGQAYFMQDCIKELYRNKANIILISGTNNRKYQPYATHQLFLCSEEDPIHKIASFSSFISAQYLFDLIYSLLYQENYDLYFNYRKQRYILDK